MNLEILIRQGGRIALLVEPSPGDVLGGDISVNTILVGDNLLNKELKETLRVILNHDLFNSIYSPANVNRTVKN
jgi:hypothetical protein